MASNDYEILVDNRSATFPSWPLIFIEMEANMGTLDAYADLNGDEVVDIFRQDSPNFGRHIYLYSISLSPAPTSLAPVRVYIDTQNRQVYVDPESAHAQAGEYLTGIIHPATRFFDLLPGFVNWISVRNAPNSTDFTYGIRWRKAYSG
jgi:hypothetical protein